LLSRAEDEDIPMPGLRLRLESLHGTSRRRTTKHRIDRDCPFQVAIPIPLGGLGQRLMSMHAFCRNQAMPYHTKSDHRDIGDFTLFCFAEPAHANTFTAGFGGERIMLRRLASADRVVETGA
jgi:hypothetical protein